VKTFREFGIDIGNKTGVEIKVTCPQCSPSRRKKNYPCLNVNTEKGMWNCWHCGWRGSLGKGEESRPMVEKVFRKPVYVENRTELSEKVVAYFAQRGISQGTLLRNRIGFGSAYFPQVEEERTCIMFPYYRGEEVINVKYRTHDKLFRLASGAERVLYGLNDIDEVLIWVEGEMDKLSMEEAGFKNCVSVPDGAPAPDTKNYANKFDFLDCKELGSVRQHIIAVDDDAPGRRLQEELVRRLGPEKCLTVTWPVGSKDANDVLQKYGPDELASCVVKAEPMPVQGASTVRNYRQEILRRYEGEVQKGVPCGWSGMDGLYSVLPGEWTLVTGVPGSGKSEWLDALQVNLARDYGWNFAIFSPENHPADYHMEKLFEKVVGKPFGDGPTPKMSVADLETAMEFVEDHFTWLEPEKTTLDELLGRATELVQRKGIQGLVLDPWNEIDHMTRTAQSETDYISASLTKVRKFCRQHGVHTWIVAHPTKLQKDPTTKKYPIPTPYDVAGSAHWRNKADNCITVHRDQIDGSTPVEIHVQKVRKKHVGRVGMAELRYDRVTGRYTDWAIAGAIYSWNPGSQPERAA
jgi:twinkle protein